MLRFYSRDQPFIPPPYPRWLGNQGMLSHLLFLQKSLIFFDFQRQDIGTNRTLSWDHGPIFMWLHVTQIRILWCLILTNAGCKLSRRIITFRHKLNSQGNILYRLQASQPVLPCSFCRNTRKWNRFSFAVTKVNLTKFCGLQSEQDD